VGQNRPRQLVLDLSGVADRRRMMGAELATAANRIRSDSIKIGIAPFIAGGSPALVVTWLVHPFH